MVIPLRASSRVKASFIWKPPFGISLEILSGDGGVEGQKGTHILHRKIGAQSEPSRLFQKFFERIGALHPLLAQAVFRPVHVAGGMGGLYRRDDVLPEIFKIHGIDDLGVLDFQRRPGPSRKTLS